MHTMKTERLPKRGRDELAPSRLALVNDYNKFMGGVDRNDALVGNYSCVRKTSKWTLKVVMHFIEEAVLNAYVLYDKINLGKCRFTNYKMDIIEATINKARITEDPTIFIMPTVGRYFMELIPPTETKAKPQKRCVICTIKEKRKESRYQCKNCPTHPGLCPAPCFELHHTE